MAKSPKVTKLNLDTETIMVPLDMLDPSPDNVRVTHRSADVANLAASIAAEGLLQNLGVTPGAGPDGEPTGRYEVAAGERRRQALLLLAGQKRLAKNAAIPCRLVPRDGARSVSLSENVQRVVMHPADEYEAFARLHDAGRGLTVAQIAERHGVSEHTVKQRLRLGTASPRLMAAFRDGTLTLAQLMAYCATDDQAAQERVFGTLPYQSEYAIRRALLEDKVPLDDRRVRAVGLDAYTAAGGTVTRDLFSARGEGWVTDVDLLNRLAGERLEAVAEGMRGEGWAWVVAAAAPPTDLYLYRRKAPEPVPLTPEEDARLSALGGRYDEIEATSQDQGELTDEQGEELARIEAEIEAIQDRQDHYSPELRAQTGVFVTFGAAGIEASRGWERQEEQPPKPTPERPASNDQDDTGGSGDERSTVSDNPTVEAPALSAALTEELLAHRTAGLQAEVARRPSLALRVLLQSLILDMLHQGHRAPCKISVREPQLRAACPSIDGTPARKELADRKAIVAAWKLPQDAGLLTWLMDKQDDEIHEMLAVLIAHGMDAGRADWTTPKGAGEAAAQVAGLAELDMRQWWQPTAETYFTRVPKGMILDAMREGAGDVGIRHSDSRKKADLAAAATALLDGKGWLPALLRCPQSAQDSVDEAA